MRHSRRAATGPVIGSVTGLALGLLSAFAGSASADWLVLKDGSRLETKGGWQNRGRLIVFERSTGGLASMRADEIDFEKSQEATAASLRPAPPAPTAAPAALRAPVLVLTDDNVPKAIPAEEADPGATSAAGNMTIRVTNWDRLDSDNGIEVAGVLRNESDGVAERITVRVVALDDQRQVIGSAGANVAIGELGPGQTSSFRALLAGFKKVGGLRFETSGFRKVVAEDETGATEDQAQQ